MQQPFLQAIGRSRRRVLLGRLLSGLADVLLFVFLASVAYFTAAAPAGFGTAAGAGFAIALALVSLLCLFLELRRGTSLEAVAQSLDRAFGFRDRLSSALSFSRLPEPTGFMRAHIQETLAFLAAQPESALPIPIPARSRVYVAAVAIAFVSLVPHSDRLSTEVGEREVAIERRARVASGLVSELRDLRSRANLRGLKKISHWVEVAERAVAEEQKILEPEELTPPEKTATRDAPEQRNRAFESQTEPGEGRDPKADIRLALAAQYQPVGKFDSFPDQSYQEVFAEIDALVVDGTLTSGELKQLANQVDGAAGKIGNFGFFEADKNNGLEGSMRNVDSRFGTTRGEQMPQGEFDGIKNQLAPLQFKAFSEFLKRYASHVGARALGQAQQEARRREVETVAASVPPPKDAEFKLTGVGDRPEAPLLQAPGAQAAKLLQALASAEGSDQDLRQNALKVRGGGTQVGGQGAGVGASGGRKGAPQVLPQASGGEYLPLEGKLGDGESILQIIDQRGRRTLSSGQKPAGSSYRDVYIEYAKGAEAALNGEEVPLPMRDFVRDYFRSIRPDAPAQGHDAG